MSTQEAADLLPCPHCNAAPKLIGPDAHTNIFVMCMECGARGLIVIAAHGGATEEAVAAWNRRQVADLIQKLTLERDDARDALLVEVARRENLERYLAFVARWAWRDGEHLTDEERLSCIKFYPPIKALADGNALKEL